MEREIQDGLRIVAAFVLGYEHATCFQKRKTPYANPEMQKSYLGGMQIWITGSPADAKNVMRGKKSLEQIIRLSAATSCTLESTEAGQ